MSKEQKQPRKLEPAAAYWTAKQFAAWLNVSGRTVFRMIEAGEPIPHVRFGPRGLRIPVEGGKAYATQKQAAAA
jgi:excisionase family DNA binding protein